jgi:hypothetical protein
MGRTWCVPGQLDGRCGTSGPVARLGNPGRRRSWRERARHPADVERRLGQYRSGRAAVLVDKSAEDVDAFDACIRFGGCAERSPRVDWSLEVDAAVGPVLRGSARARRIDLPVCAAQGLMHESYVAQQVWCKCDTPGLSARWSGVELGHELSVGGAGGGEVLVALLELDVEVDSLLF